MAEALGRDARAPSAPASSIAEVYYKVPRQNTADFDIVKLYLHKRKPGRPPMLSMAVMYRAMPGHASQSLKLYADKIGALDLEGQRLHDEKQNAIREVDPAERRRKRPPREGGARCGLARGERPPSASRSERKGNGRYPPRRAARAGARCQAGPRGPVGEPGPLIREQAQRDCLRDAMMRQRTPRSMGAAALSIDTAVSSGAMRAVRPLWTRGPAVCCGAWCGDSIFETTLGIGAPWPEWCEAAFRQRQCCLLFWGMRKLGEKAREDLSKMIEARAEGTTCIKRGRRGGSSSSKAGSVFVEREGTLDRVAAELLVAVGSGGSGKVRGAGRVGTAGRAGTRSGTRSGVLGGSRGAAPEDGEKSVVTIEALRGWWGRGGRRRLPARGENLNGDLWGRCDEGYDASIEFSPAVREAVLNGTILETVRGR